MAPIACPRWRCGATGGRIVVDGGLEGWGRHIDCVGGMTIDNVLHVFGRRVTHVRDSRAVAVGGVGRVEYADLPVITAHVPLDARIATGGAVWGKIGATRSLTLQTTGCGDWAAGRVQGALGVQAVGSGDVRAADVGTAHVQLSGSGDVSMGQVAGGADVALNGSGDVQTGPVGGPLQVALSGSGDVTVASVNAPVRAQIASSGDVRIHGGRAPQVQVNVSGSGDFDFRGEAGSLQAAVAGLRRCPRRPRRRPGQQERSGLGRGGCGPVSQIAYPGGSPYIQAMPASRLEARLPSETHALLKRAAEMQGRSLTDFVVTAASEAAVRLISEHQLIQLSLEDQRRFAEALLNPPPEAPAMRRARERRRVLFGEG